MSTDPNYGTLGHNRPQKAERPKRVKFAMLGAHSAGLVFTDDALARATEALQARIAKGEVLGQLGFTRNGRVDITKVSHKVVGAEHKPGSGMIEVELEVLDTPEGKKLAELISGSRLSDGYSMAPRGVGTPPHELAIGGFDVGLATEAPGSLLLAPKRELRAIMDSPAVEALRLSPGQLDAAAAEINARSRERPGSPFEQVANHPLPDDSLNYAGGLLRFKMKEAGVIGYLVERTALARVTNARGESEYRSEVSEHVIDRVLWSDLVRFACTVERAEIPPNGARRLREGRTEEFDGVAWKPLFPPGVEPGT